jgi:uncharacterized protein
LIVEPNFIFSAHFIKQEIPKSLKVKVRLQPKSSINKITGISDNTLKVYVHAPPADDKANYACLKVLADFFKIPKSRISLVSGKKTRDKVFDIPELDDIRFNEILTEFKK